MKNSDQVFDELLVLNAQSGDHRAINLLVSRWDRKLKHQVYRHTNDMEVVNDIAQEAWIAIVKGIHTLSDVQKFGAWALSIASRKSIDWIRKTQTERKRQEVREMVQEELYEESDSQEGVIEQLGKALKELPKDQHMIISLYYLESMNVTEISRVLKIPPGTVKSRLFYAREQLKSIINSVQNEK